MYEKVRGRICLFPRIGELGGSKNCHIWNIITYWTRKVDSFCGLILPKLPLILKNASKKSCSTLNFVQKSQWAYMSLSPRRGARGSKDCHLWNIITDWNDNVDTLYSLMLPKLPIISKNASNNSYWVLNFVQKINSKILKTTLLWASRSVQDTKENYYFGLQISVPNQNSLCTPCASNCL